MSDYWESDEITNKERLGELLAEIAALRAKVALFDVLAARIEAGAWDLPVSEFPIAIRIRRTGERVFDVTLAGAVEKAMEAEARE